MESNKTKTIIGLLDFRNPSFMRATQATAEHLRVNKERRSGAPAFRGQTVRTDIRTKCFTRIERIYTKPGCDQIVACRDRGLKSRIFRFSDSGFRTCSSTLRVPQFSTSRLLTFVQYCPVAN